MMAISFLLSYFCKKKMMKKKLDNRITYFPFILLGIIIIYLIINSFIGKTLQNSTDIPNLYTSTPLLFLWGLLGVTGMVVLLRNGDGRKMPLLLFHCSLILILLELVSLTLLMKAESCIYEKV